MPYIITKYLLAIIQIQTL